MPEGERIGLLAAMADEAAPLKGELTGGHTNLVAGYSIVEGTLRGHDVVLLQCGVGKVAAAMATQLLICSYGVSLVMLSGTAGSACSDCRLGDVIIATEVIEHDVGFLGRDGFTSLGSLGMDKSGVPVFYRSFRAADHVLVAARQAAGRSEMASEKAKEEPLRVREGALATGDQFIFDPAARQRIFHDFTALAMDTEAAAVAKVATQNGVDFLVIKAISDGEGESLGVDIGRLTGFQRESQSLLQKIGSVGSAFGYIVGDPGVVGRLVNMRRNLRIAAGNAGRLVKDIVESL
ncbi:MAG: 5'-methylthioadenosine/S-adenosylhomocysteine nucleosidase [Chloroflexi bacterium]|nr:5'-methylthioadenosine/S-adenosylhomocysteine nucleosidase [Chloroflexota bacterium]